MELENIDELLVHLFDIKIKTPYFGKLIVVVEDKRVVNVKKEQSFKNKGEVRRK